MFAECELTAAQFERITGLLYAHAGIRMRAGKEGLVRARLTKRLRALGLPDFDAYLSHVESQRDRSEFAEMIDALTTNKTSFLRESAHFDYLRDHVLPSLTGSVRIWSAGCSSGEEPYTLAMLTGEAYETANVRDVRILATDISHRVLATAKAGVYGADLMHDVPAAWLQRYWTRRKEHGRDVFVATPALRKPVHFAKLNLMERWPMQGPFDAILCRNVMIYFDKATQQQLVERYWALLRPGGHLFVGHSESLTGMAHRFRYVQPAVYVK
jgi:chemotaxis protein methyltransferase CheR